MPSNKHSDYHVTIPLNKVEFIAFGHTLGWILPWIRPHCKGYRSTFPFDLSDPPLEEDVDEYSPAELDILFTSILLNIGKNLLIVKAVGS